MSDVPSQAKLAGWLWITFGAFGLIMSILSFMGVVGNKTDGTLCCPIIISLVFLYAGQQTLNGHARDTIGSSIGSIIFGLVYFAIGIFVLNLRSNPKPNVVVDRPLALIVGLVSFALGGMLLGAGALGISGRQEYLDWRDGARRRKKKKKKRPVRKAEDDDEEDDRGFEVVDDDDRPPPRRRREQDAGFEVVDDDDRPPPRRRREQDAGFEVVDDDEPERPRRRRRPADDEE